MKIFFQKNIRVITGAFFILGVIFYPATAKAEEKNSGPAISVVPHTFDLNVFPGEIVKDKIKVYNQGHIAVPFRLKLISFDAQDRTGEMKLNDLEGENSFLKEWIKFEKEDFVVDPGEKEAIDFSIKIPANAKNQGYYCTALLQADISTYYFNESRVQAVPNLAILFLLKVGEDRPDEGGLSILDYSIPEEKRLIKTEKVVNFISAPFLDNDERVAVINSGRPEFVVKLKNSSPYHAKLTGKIDLDGLGWKVKNEMEFPSLTILPGKTREVLIMKLDEKTVAEKNSGEESRGLVKENGELGFGITRARLNLEEKGGRPKEEDRWIFVFSWKLVAWLMFLIALIRVVLKMAKRKLKKKSPFPRETAKTDPKNEGKTNKKIRALEEKTEKSSGKNPTDSGGDLHKKVVKLEKIANKKKADNDKMSVSRKKIKKENVKKKAKEHKPKKRMGKNSPQKSQRKGSKKGRKRAKKTRS